MLKVVSLFPAVLYHSLSSTTALIVTVVTINVEVISPGGVNLLHCLHVHVDMVSAILMDLMSNKKLQWRELIQKKLKKVFL